MNKEPPLDPKIYVQGKDYVNTSRKQAKSRLASQTAARWVISIICWTFVITILLSLFSNKAVGGMGVFSAVMVLLLFIAIGIIFDVVGISVASADDKPFHSMAARRVPGSYQALKLLKSADKVSCICNDVVGDITGIISGATVTVVVSQMVDGFSLPEVITQLLFSAIVASLTVGGKAMGKSFAMKHNVKVVHSVGKLMFFYLRLKRKIRRMLGRDRA